MATEKLTLLTEVKGAAQVAGQIGKIEGAIDRVSTKAGNLRTKLGGAVGAAGNFLSRSGLGYTALNFAGEFGAQTLAASNAGTGGPAGVLGNVGGAAASGAAMGAAAGPIGALAGAAAGAAVGIGKSAVEIGEATSKMADQVSATGKDALAHNPTLEELNTSIAGIDKGLADLTSNGLNFFLGGGDAAKKLTDLKAEYERQRDTLMQEGADTERALRANANAVVQAINGIDVKPQVNVNVAVTSRTVQEAQQQSDRYGGTYVPGGVRGF